MPGWMFVHAHPDDESIWTGGTAAALAARGEEVTIVTCTRGERGEVLDPQWAHLVGDSAAMAAHRENELAAAVATLGVPCHYYLGQLDPAWLPNAAKRGPVADGAERAAPTTVPPGSPTTATYRARFEDSGMVWASPGVATHAPDSPPQAFARAGVVDAAAWLMPLLERHAPDVVVTYDPGGGYGHPDHVQAHLVTHQAVADWVAAGAPRPRVLWSVLDEAALRVGCDQVAAQGLVPVSLEGDVPSQVVPSQQVAVRVPLGQAMVAKRRALLCHQSQVVVADGAFSIVNGVYLPLLGQECYQDATDEEARDL